MCIRDFSETPCSFYKTCATLPILHINDVTNVYYIIQLYATLKYIIVASFVLQLSHSLKIRFVSDLLEL